MTNTKTFSAPRYHLAQRIGGRLYQLSGLGTFSSGMAAADCWRSKPRNGVALVVEERDVTRFGVTYGISSQIVATVTR